MNKKYLFRVLGVTLFIPGVVLGMLLFGVAAWADLEATLYGFLGIGAERLTTMECPVLMTTHEVGTVSVSLTNPGNTPIDVRVCADFSNKDMIRTECSTLSLGGHQHKNKVWEVTSADIDIRNFIFAQITNYSAVPIHAHQGTCGIMVLNLPYFTGNQVFTFSLVVTLVGIVGGLVFWDIFGKTQIGKLHEISRLMRVLGLLVLLGLLASLLDYWIIGIALFAITILAISVIFGFLLAQ